MAQRVVSLEAWRPELDVWSSHRGGRREAALESCLHLDVYVMTRAHTQTCTHKHVHTQMHTWAHTYTLIFNLLKIKLFGLLLTCNGILCIVTILLHSVTGFLFFFKYISKNKCFKCSQSKDDHFTIKTSCFFFCCCFTLEIFITIKSERFYLCFFLGILTAILAFYLGL